MVISVTKEVFSHQILKFIFNLTGKKKGGTITNILIHLYKKKKIKIIFLFIYVVIINFKKKKIFSRSFFFKEVTITKPLFGLEYFHKRKFLIEGDI